MVGGVVAVAADTRFAARSCGSRHPDTLVSISNLGSLLQAQGDLEGAAALLREVLEARRETLGECVATRSEPQRGARGVGDVAVVRRRVRRRRPLRNAKGAYAISVVLMIQM